MKNINGRTRFVNWGYGLLIIFFILQAWTSAKALVATGWPAKVSGSQNPEIQWKGDDKQEYKVVLGWKSTSNHTLEIIQKPAISGGKITVQAKSSCHGCMVRLYCFDANKNIWEKIGEIQALSNQVRTIVASLLSQPVAQPATQYVLIPNKGKILEIKDVKYVAKEKYDVKVKNKTDYFYGITLHCGQPPNYKANIILGKQEEKTFAGIESKIFPYGPYPYYYEVKAKFSLGLYYLQAAYALLFGGPPPTSRLEFVITLISESKGWPVDTAYSMDAETLVVTFAELVKKDEKFRIELAKLAGKKGGEKMIKETAEKVLFLKDIKDKADALWYFLKSLRATDSEEIRIDIRK